MNLWKKRLLSTACSIAVLSQIAMAAEPEAFGSPRTSRGTKLVLPYPSTDAARLVGKGSMSSVKERLAETHGQAWNVFKGAEDYVAETVAQYRAWEKGKAEADRQSEHCEACIPLVHKFQAYVQELKTKDAFRSVQDQKILDKFLREVQFKLEEEQISPLYQALLPLRLAAAFYHKVDASEQADEQDVSIHAPFAEYLLGSIKGDVWKDYYRTISSIKDKADIFEKLHPVTNYITRYAGSDAVTKAIKKLDKLLGESILYPLQNQGILGVSFLTESILDDVYPVAFPFFKSKKAHGVKMSTVGFSAHDIVHSELDDRRRALIKHILTRMDAFVKAGGDAGDFVEKYIPVAVQKYKVLMQTFKGISDVALIQLENEEISLKEYKKIMSGFFYILHEELDLFSPNYFDEKNLQKVLARFAGTQEGYEYERIWYTNFFTSGYFEALYFSPVVAAQVIDEKHQSFDWESARDIFVTSPTTGASALSDEQIIERVMNEYSISDSKEKRVFSGFSYHTEAETKPIKEVAEELGLVEKKVTRSARFIDVTFRTKSGEKCSFTFPTLYHKFENADDFTGLLKYSGYILEKPDLSTVSEAEHRAKVQEHLENVKRTIGRLKSSFYNFAVDAVKVKLGKESLETRYARWHDLQEKMLNTYLGEEYTKSKPAKK